MGRVWVCVGGGISGISILKPVVLIGKETFEQSPAGDVGRSHHKLLGKGRSRQRENMYEGPRACLKCSRGNKEASVAGTSRREESRMT